MAFHSTVVVCVLLRLLLVFTLWWGQNVGCCCYSYALVGLINGH